MVNKKTLRTEVAKGIMPDGNPQFIAPLGSRKGLNGIIAVKIAAINPKIKTGINATQGEIRGNLI